GFGWQSGPELVEPLAEGVQGEAAEAAKLDVGQPGAAEIGQDGGPIDFAGREGHGAVSGDRSVTGPIMRPPREILKMHFTGRLRGTGRWPCRGRRRPAHARGGCRYD